ncbi:MAG TPA: nucleotidyltransferase family protein [Candidatus Krumholzibacteriaceae bacterium]|nr:nucleotidyltransferase family protein [Candidatus Krumholzibacteriaceae bacterium]
MKVSAVVLAAGLSRRMGANKLLLKIGGKTVLEHILDRLIDYETVVVTGHSPNKIMGVVGRYDVKTVHNPDYEKGMTTSFQTGLRAIDSDAAFMVLSDTFGFSGTLLRRMEDELRGHPEALLVSPVYKGRRGHPVLVRSPLFREFLELGSDETMKDVVDRHETEHRYIEGDVWTVTDLDTPEDYEKVRRLWETRN